MQPGGEDSADRAELSAARHADAMMLAASALVQPPCGKPAAGYDQTVKQAAASHPPMPSVGFLYLRHARPRHPRRRYAASGCDLCGTGPSRARRVEWPAADALASARRRFAAAFRGRRPSGGAALPMMRASAQRRKVPASMRLLSWLAALVLVAACASKPVEEKSVPVTSARAARRPHPPSSLPSSPSSGILAWT